MYKIEIVKHKVRGKTRYDWRLRAPNGQIMATGHGQGYHSPSAAKKAVARVRQVLCAKFDQQLIGDLTVKVE